jgi:biopolymer transport protein ExbD
MAVHCALPVQLPSSTAVQIETEQAIAVTLKADGDTISIFIDAQPVTLDQLTTVLSQKRGSDNKKEPEVQIYGDQSVSYQQLFDVLDRIKAAGLQRISLAAEREKE